MSAMSVSGCRDYGHVLAVMDMNQMYWRGAYKNVNYCHHINEYSNLHISCNLNAEVVTTNDRVRIHRRRLPRARLRVRLGVSVAGRFSVSRRESLGRGAPAPVGRRRLGGGVTSSLPADN
ncbi:hypothetical protein ACJJTC_013216 [Scirpophaga incertulas]